MMRCGAWGVAVSVAMTGSVFGAGFQLYTEGSAEALGQAGAVSGRKGLISQAWYNPAALAGAERPQIMIGSAFVSIRTDYKNDFTTAADSSMSDEWRVIPHLYYVQPISEKWTAMVSVNAPYGLITEWPTDWSGALFATYSELRTVYFTPSVAWKPLDMLSVSAGFNVVDAEARLEGTGRVVEGDDIGYGGTFSAHLQPLDDWGIGFRYQSRVMLEVEGTINGSLATSADLELPSSINVGLANTSFNKLALGLDLVWTEWSTYEVLAVEGLSPSAKNWEDVISIRLGGEYALGDEWMLRAGYIWDQSPVPDETRAPEMPGTDRQMITFGAGWKCWKTLTLDVAYSYLWADEGRMGSDITSVAPGLAGTFETTTHLVGISASYTF